MEKCEFHKKEMEFLGFIVGHGQVKMDKGQVAAVENWKSPTNKKELQTFLGFTNFYQKFIKDLTKVSIQLTPLTGNKEWEWKDKQENAFQWIKEQMCKEPILWTLKDDG